MLLSAGGFAVYRTESSVFNVLRPWFGDLAKAKNRERLMDAWIPSKLFERSGLDASEIRAAIASECRNWGDFLRVLMREISRNQDAIRWADCTPDHLLYIPEIKRAFPDALVIHIIRDGRDVALSLAKQGWIRPLPGYGQSGLLAAGLYWEWAVRKGRRIARAIPGDYLEVRFEDLMETPRKTLGDVSSFIHQDLDYERIVETGIGSVKTPNTSFGGDAAGSDFAPVGRWKTALSPGQLASLEAMLDTTLMELGYLSSEDARRRSLAMAGMGCMYRASFGAKLWMKRHTSVGRVVSKPDLSWL